MDRCINCGITLSESAAFCTHCGYPVEEQKYVAWEDLKKRGFFPALWETLKESIFSPNRFFGKLPYKGGIWKPLGYALIFILFSAIINITYDQFGLSFYGFENTNNNKAGSLDNYDESGEFDNYEYDFYKSLRLKSRLYRAGFQIIGIFALAGFCHLILMLLRGSSRSFESTFRAVSYSQGALAIVIIPFIGDWVYPIWLAVISIIGLKHLQQTSWVKASMAYIIPILTCFCAVFSAVIWLLTLLGGPGFFETIFDFLTTGKL